MQTDLGAFHGTVACSRCSRLIGKDDVHQADGSIYCGECYGLLDVCAACGEKFQPSAVETINGATYCRACADEMFVRCTDCNCTIKEDDAKWAFDDPYCADCYCDRFTTCDACGAVVYIDDSYSNDGDTFCESCWDERFTSCDSCGADVPRDDIISYNDQYLCERCYERAVRQRVIHEYNYKPEVSFWTIDDEPHIFYGIELEVDMQPRKMGEKSDDSDGIYEFLLRSGRVVGVVDEHGAPVNWDEKMPGEDPAKAVVALDIMGRDRAYAKHDGSLRSGFEIVTHPMTFEFHVQKAKWKEAMKALNDMGFTAHDCGTCGLHIHVSKKSLGATQEARERTFKALLVFLRKFWAQLVVFSRRREDSLLRYAKPYQHSSPDSMYREACSSDTGKYYAINFKPRSTVEFRFYRGTLNYDTFLACLQLTHEIVKYCIANSPDAVDDATWADFARAIRGKHKELDAYMNRKGLGA
jgi:formylmethanofuran dehydrogenase subunit E